MVGIGTVSLLSIAIALLAEIFWFQEVGYLNVFTTRLLWQGGLGLGVGIGSMACLWGNLAIARSHIKDSSPYPTSDPTPPLRLPGLLPLVLALSLTFSLLLAHYGQAVVDHWPPDSSLNHSLATLGQPGWRSLWLILQQILAQPGWLIGLLITALTLVIIPQFVLRIWTVPLSLGFGFVVSTYWPQVLLAFNAVPFATSDPVFHRDVGFYIFLLPLGELAHFWLLGLLALTLLGVSLIYLLARDSLSQGQFSGFTARQWRHLYTLGGALMLVVSISQWLDRYELLYSPQGVVYGASYTDVRVQLPAHTFLSIVGLGMAIYLFSLALRTNPPGSRIGLRQRIFRLWMHVGSTRQTTPDRRQPSSSNSQSWSSEGESSPAEGSSWSSSQQPVTSRRPISSFDPQRWSSEGQRAREIKQRSSSRPQGSGPGSGDRPANLQRRAAAIHNPSTTELPTGTNNPLRARLPHHLFYLLSIYACLIVLATSLLPILVQRLVVQPNELGLEQPFITRAIALTRQAFNLEIVESETFNPEYTLNAAALQRNQLTVDNIRLWDTRPLLETNRQLQRIRPYYEFPGADIDRYLLPTANGGTALQQVLIAARELDYNSVPAEAKTWVNQHLIYTHGYGFTLSPVNRAAEGGLPDYFIQGIEQSVSDERIRDFIPTGTPRIYYGELTNNYVLTQTRVGELDYPSGSENVYNRYEGQGGIAVGSFWRRSLYAVYLRDWRMMLTENITPQTRLLLRRQISDRVRAIAPFLRYDRDPYLVVASTPDPQAPEAAEISSNPTSPSPTSNSLYWIIDAYTTSDRYPYSDPGGNDFNYIRNSVKVVVDAYNGSVRFYVSDPQDPIIQTWQRVFPGMFQSLQTMPAALKAHIRYPQDFYRIQSNQLMVYHMTDPQVFYNREDQWRAPNEIYGDQPTLVEPYYLIMKLPIGDAEEFVLLRPYTPAQRINLIGWLAARSDGENYGKMLLYQFPKQELFYGPEQLEARINQDPIISQQISLWNRRGSRANQGNLLVIPIERSLLYVEPLYLEAEQNRLPTLVRVIVAYANRITMAATLQQALDAIFQPTPVNTPAIIRPLPRETAP